MFKNLVVAILQNVDLDLDRLINQLNVDIGVYTPRQAAKSLMRPIRCLIMPRPRYFVAVYVSQKLILSLKMINGDFAASNQPLRVELLGRVIHGSRQLVDSVYSVKAGAGS